MNPQALKLRLSSFFSLLFASSTLNPFHHQSSSPSPSNKTPEATDSDISVPPRGKGISETRVSYFSCPNNSLDTSTQISHSAEEEKRNDELLAETTSEGTSSSFASKDSFPESKTTHIPQFENETRMRNNFKSKFLHVMEIMDEQDLGKHFLGLSIPTGVGLVVSASSLVKTTEIQIIVILLSFSIAFICNGLLLRKSYNKLSTLILISGVALMMLSFYSLVSCYLPNYYLKLIPFFCWLVSLVPFALYSWANFERERMKDLEKGELIIGKTNMQSHISN